MVSFLDSSNSGIHHSLSLLDGESRIYERLGRLEQGQKIQVLDGGNDFQISGYALTRTLNSYIWGGTSRDETYEFLGKLRAKTFRLLNQINFEIEENAFTCHEWKRSADWGVQSEAVVETGIVLKKLLKNLRSGERGLEVLCQTYRDDGAALEKLTLEKERINELLGEVYQSFEKISSRKSDLQNSMIKVQNKIVQHLIPQKESQEFSRGAFAYAHSPEEKAFCLSEDILLRRIGGFCDRLIGDRGLQDLRQVLDHEDVSLPFLLQKDLSRQNTFIAGEMVPADLSDEEKVKFLYEKILAFTGGDKESAAFFAKFCNQLSTVELMEAVSKRLSSNSLSTQLRQRNIQPGSGEKNTTVSLYRNEVTAEPMLKVSTHFEVFHAHENLLGGVEGTMILNLSTQEAKFYSTELRAPQGRERKQMAMKTAEEFERRLSEFKNVATASPPILDGSVLLDVAGSTPGVDRASASSIASRVVPQVIGKCLNTFAYIRDPMAACKTLEKPCFKDGYNLTEGYNSIRNNQRFVTSSLSAIDRLHREKGLKIQYVLDYTHGRVSPDESDRTEIFHKTVTDWMNSSDKYLAIPLVTGSGQSSHVTVVFLEKGVDKIDFFDSLGRNPAESKFTKGPEGTPSVSIDMILDNLKVALDRYVGGDHQKNVLVQSTGAIQEDYYNCGAYVANYCEKRAEGRTAEEAVRVMPSHGGIIDYRNRLLADLHPMILSLTGDDMSGTGGWDPDEDDFDFPDDSTVDLEEGEDQGLDSQFQKGPSEASSPRF